MRIKILLLALLAVSFTATAQTTEYFLTVKPENRVEEKAVHKLDSALIAYVKSIKGQQALNAKALNLIFYGYYHWWMDLWDDEVIVVDTIDIMDEHEVMGYWNYTYDKLIITRFNNIYLHDTTQSIPFDSTMEWRKAPNPVEVFNSNMYLKAGIELVDYNKLADTVSYASVCTMLEDRISRDMHIVQVNDTLLLSEYNLNPDTTILPHVNIANVLHQIQNSAAYGNDITVYTDWTFANPYEKYTTNYQFMHHDTFSLPDLNDPNIIHDSIIISYVNIKAVNLVYRWFYTYQKPADTFWLGNYLTLTRKPYAIGFELENGKQFYIRHADAMYALKDHGYPAEGFNQCMEAVFYKTLKFDLATQWRVEKKR